ncbi:MAG: hypothetical protein FWG45_07045 [Oscillospiraceae bacterium]|nr:hypothetical protein [Oscillospiraceae bacterium]
MKKRKIISMFLSFAMLVGMITLSDINTASADTVYLIDISYADFCLTREVDFEWLNFLFRFRR